MKSKSNKRQQDAELESTATQNSDEGTLMMNPGGYGFVQRSGLLPSVFIPPHRLRGAIDGDRVRVQSWTAEKGEEGDIIEIISRRRTRIVGVLSRASSRQWVIEPDDARIVHRVVLVQEPPNDAKPGQLVSGWVVVYPDANMAEIQVRFDQVIGDPGVLSVEVRKILLENGIEESFPSAVLREGRRAPKAVRDKDLVARKDLRAIPFMTIDPPDARDFDDAVAVEFPDGDHVLGVARLYVAVADVSHYVRPGTAIDEEAKRRCFSVYLPDRSIPMLPAELSSHICSLVPNEDRLAMVVRMDVDAAGQVLDAEVMAAVIHSRRRLTYAQAAAVMAEQEHDVSSEEAERIAELRLVADRLRRVRMQRGALELQLPDSKVLLDEDDPERIRDIVPAKSSREIKRAYNLIEELMLAANESVGRIAVARALPVLFRTHEEPDTEKLEKLVASAEVLGLKLEVEKLKTPRGVQKFISKLKGHPQNAVLQMLLLRCMAQAVYWAENRPHFALASESYVHFTSPIRRYADLISHRVLKGFLIREGQFEGGASLRKLPSPQECVEAARDSSEQERIIMQVERSVKSVYSAAFMRDKIGETFSGYVSGLSAHGAFVLLDSPNVDGYWPLNRKDEAREYELVDANTTLRSTKTGHLVELGQRVDVEVVDASVIRRQVEFTAAPNTPKRRV